MIKRYTARARAFALALAGLIGATSPAAWAQQAEAYPSRPVQVIVGFPGGGGMDVATRIVTNGMTAEGLSPLVVINKPGASATIAATQVARSAPDGYTLGLATSANLGIAPSLYKKLGYSVDTDFAPIAQFAVAQNVIYANADSGIASLKDLMSRIKKAPGQLNYASPGSGTTPHLGFEMLKAKHQLFVVHVPFRGSPAAISAVLANELAFGVDTIGPTLPFLKSGKLVALAQTGESRSGALPDVPTLKELGIPGIPSGTYLGLVAPARTPEPVLAQVRESIKRFLAKPGTQAQLTQVGMDARYLDGREFAKVIAEETKPWEAAVKYSGATPN